MNKPCAYPPAIVQDESTSTPGGLFLLDSSILEDLKPAALETLAKSLEKQAKTLRLHAADKRAAKHTPADAYMEGVHALPGMISAYLGTGMSYDAAVVATARQSALPVETVEANYRVYLKNNDIEAKNARRLLVARMAPHATNGEIADRLGFHRNTIGDDLKQILRD